MPLLPKRLQWVAVAYGARRNLWLTPAHMETHAMTVRSLPLLLVFLFAAVPQAACQVSEPAPPVPAPPGRASAPSPEREARGEYRAGDPVEIEWKGGWYRGHVLEAEAERFKVGYDGYSDTWDEWVGAERLRRVAADPQAAGPETGGPETGAPGRGASATGAAASAPPLGKYVCRQYTTTMGYLTLRPGGVYEVSGVTGRYRYDAGSGVVEWDGGSYDDWDWAGRYEHVSRPAGDGRPDEDIIRLTSEADGLRIACYKMAGD